MKQILHLLVLLLACNIVFGQAGKLDPSFGNNGKSIVGYLKGQGSSVFDVAVQSNNKIIGIGQYKTYDAGVFRCNANGGLDSGFGINGFANTDIVYNGQEGYPSAVVIQPDDKIIVAFEKTSSLRLARYTANGKPDSTFGKNAVTVNNSINPFGMALGSDGKIVVCSNDSIARFYSNGTIDKTFGNNGLVGLKLKPHYTIEFYNVGVDGNGKVIVTGYGKYDSQINLGDVVTVRFNKNGSLDSSFADNGVSIFGAPQQWEFPFGIYILPDNEILAGVSSTGSGPNATGVIKYKTNGSLDSSFNGKGYISIPSYPAFANDIAVQADGKIILGGTYNGSVGLLRLTTNGKFDNTFGNNGFAVAVTNRYSDAEAITLQSDGKIIAAGSIDVNSDFTFLLERFLTTGTAIATDGIQKNNSQFSASIFPNPVSNNLFIKGLNNSKPSSITISDAAGNILRQAKLVAGQNTVNVSLLKTGRYFAIIVQGDKMASVKFIK